MSFLKKHAYHQQWITLLLVYFVFTPPVYAIKASFITSPTSGPVPLIVRLNAKTSEPSPGASITKYDWTNSNKQAMLPIIGQQVIYYNPGTYTITLTVTDSLGNQDTTRQQITALSEGSTGDGTDGSTPTTPSTPPVASFTISKSSGTAPLAVTLNAGSSRATTSGASITAYQWQINPPISTTPSSRYSSVTFTQAGNYTITLTVVDSEGKTASSSKYITVSPATPVTPSPTSPKLATSQGASFYGGVLLDGSFLRNNSLIRSSDNVNLQASIMVASAHIDKAADILVAVNYPSGSGQWFLKNGNAGNNFEGWGGPTAPQPWPFVQSLLLTERVDVDIFSGQFGDLVGKFDIYIAYRLAETQQIIFNEGGLLQFEVVK
jgi:PKD repeat protein